MDTAYQQRRVTVSVLHNGKNDVTRCHLLAANGWQLASILCRQRTTLFCRGIICLTHLTQTLFKSQYIFLNPFLKTHKFYNIYLSLFAFPIPGRSIHAHIAKIQRHRGEKIHWLRPITDKETGMKLTI